MKIVSTLVVLAALIAVVMASASYNKSSAHSSTVYSESDSAEPISSEITYSASNYSTPAHYASEEDTFQADEEKENEVQAGYDSKSKNAKYKPESEYTTVTTVSYITSTPVYVTPSVYSAPDAAVSTTTIPSFPVPIYRTPAVLPYWLRSQYTQPSLPA